MALNITGNNLFWQSRIDNTRLRADAMKTQSIFQGLKRSIGKSAIMAGVGIAAGLAIREIIKVNVKFEKSISVLSSLTGAVGEDLEFYKQKAIEFGESTTQSATQIADAFKLIGSKKPELLGTKEALADVTKNAITLAEAAQVDVTAAASALTTSLNMMSAGAEKSTEYINILAAASQKGAGDIPYLDRALEKSAKVAHDANMTFAETAAMVEMLAPAFKEPSTAGLHFKAILLRLQKQGFGFTSGMFDLQEALTEVRGELDGIKDPAKRAAREIDIMGVRSITAGKVMVESRDKFKDFADTISGTNTAFEQAQTNTDNVAGSMVKLKSAIEGAILKNSDFNDGLKDIIDTITEVVRWLGDNWKMIETVAKTYLVYKSTIIGLRVAQAAYNQILKIGVLLQGGLNKAMKANAIGLIVAGVYAAIQVYKTLNKEMTEIQAVQSLNNDIYKQTEKAILEERLQLERLVKVARDETISKKERAQAIKEINKISPKYLGFITLDKINTDKATEAINLYILTLRKKARAQAISTRLIEIEGKILDIQSKKDYKRSIRELDDLNKKYKDRIAGIRKTSSLMVEINGELQRIGGTEEEIAKKEAEAEKQRRRDLKLWYVNAKNIGKELRNLLAQRSELEGGIDLSSTLLSYEGEGDKKTYGDGIKQELHAELLMRQANELAKFKLATDGTKQIVEFKKTQEKELVNFLLTTNNNFEIEAFKKKQKSEFDKFKLETDNTKKIAAFRKEQEIEFLNAEIKKNKALKPLQIETLENQIELLKLERDAIIASQFEKEEDAKTSAKDLFKIEQDLALATFLLTTDNEQAITDFKLQQEIDRLNNRILYNDVLIEDEKETLRETIELLEQQRDATDKAAEGSEYLTLMATKAGKVIESAFQSSQDSAKSFGDTMKNVAREVLLVLIAESIAHVMKDVFKKMGIKGLILAPIAAAGTAALFSSLIPKFKEGKPADMTGGGIVGGYGNGDTEIGMFTPDEIVFNKKQQNNILWNLGQYRGNNKRMEEIMSETNNLLKNTKTAVIKDNIMYVVKSGKVTGEKIYLS